MSSFNRDKEPKRKVLISFSEILFALIAMVIIIYVGYLGVGSMLETPIAITQTSEFNLTEQALYQQNYEMTETAFYLARETAQAQFTQQAISTVDSNQTNPVEIAVLNVHTITLPNGAIQNSAELSVSPLGLGSLKLTSPSTIKLGESSIIRLEIRPDSILENLPKVSAPTISVNSPEYVLEFSDRLQIYPVMTSELKGVNFEIESDNRPEKPVISYMPVEWIWNITPLSAGKQTLILVISVPVIINRNYDVASAQILKNIPIEIQVVVTPSPIPSETPTPTQTPIPTLTPTPLPPIAKISEKLTENISLIVVAIIGLIGVLVTAYVARVNGKPSEVVTPTASKSKKKGSKGK